MWVVAQSNVGVKNIARSFVGKRVGAFKLIVSKQFYHEWQVFSFFLSFFATCSIVLNECMHTLHILTD